MPKKFARIDGQSTNFKETLFNKSHVLTSASTGVSLISYRKDQRGGNSADADFTVAGDHWNYLHNFFYRSGSSKNNTDEQSKFSSIYADLGQLHPNKPLYKTKFYDSGSVFYIPQVYIGERIKSGSFQLVARTGSAVNTTNQILIRDDGNGNLYSTNAEHSQSVSSLSSKDNYVGNIFYDKGLAVITETGAWSGSINYSDFGGNSYNLKFDSHNTIATHEYNVTLLPQDYNLTMNYSIRNVLTTDTKPLTLATSTMASTFTSSDFQPYITTINLYQDGDYDTPIIQATLPRPIRKSDKINMRFKIKLDI